MPEARRLTEVAVRKILPPEFGREHYFDSLIPGFCLRVTSKGTKSWCLYFRLHGKQRLLTLGRYPALSLSKGREEARKAYQQAQGGTDPAETRRAQEVESLRKRRNTFARLTQEYLDDRKHLKTHSRIVQIFDKYVSVWNPRPIGSITRRDVIELRDSVKKNHGGSMSNYVLATVRAFFNWALDKDIIKYSPCYGVKKAVKPRPRDRVLRDSEIRTVWEAAKELDYPFGQAIQMLFATGQRIGEVSAMRWSDIDADQNVWLLTAEQTKAGRRHEVPLNAHALEILNSVPRVHDEYVFHSGRGTYIKGWAKPEKWLYGKTDLNEPWTPHDIRRTVSSVMRERLSVPIDVIAGVNNHAPTSVTEKHYARRVGLEDKRVALEKWAAFLLHVLEGVTATIVPFEGRASSR